MCAPDERWFYSVCQHTVDTTSPPCKGKGHAFCADKPTKRFKRNRGTKCPRCVRAEEEARKREEEERQRKQKFFEESMKRAAGQMSMFGGGYTGWGFGQRRK